MGLRLAADAIQAAPSQVIQRDILAADCLLILLSNNSQYLAQFCEGVSTGAGWARYRDLITSQGFAGTDTAVPLHLVDRTESGFEASEDVATSPSSNLQNQQLPGLFQLLAGCPGC